ncbi:MAG: ABC transporter permease [bacterium]|nr:ABC transporter permease [bacterium]
MTTERLVWWILAILVVSCVIASPTFSKPRNLTNVFLKNPVSFGIASLGQVFVVIAGGIDLSIGSVISLLTSLTAGTFKSYPDVSPVLVVLMIVGLGALIGALNGIIVVKLNVTPFMATLATMSVFQGLALFYTSRTIGGIPRSFRYLARGKIGSVPLGFVIFVIVTGVCYLILNKNRLGKHIYAVGGDPYVARISGIAVERIKFLSYMLCGVMVGVASVFLAAKMGGGGPKVAVGYELDSITAVVIGGISLAGGAGSLFGAIGGVMIIGVFSNIMNLLNVNPFYQIVLKGLLLILTVSFYSKKSR